MDSIDSHGATSQAAPWAHATSRAKSRAARLLGALCLAGASCALACHTPTPPDVASAPPAGHAARAAAHAAAESRAAGDALVRIETGGHGLLFVRPDHGIGRYDDLLIEHIGFRYAPRQKSLSFREEERISALLKAAVEGHRDGVIGLANEAGPCVLAVRFLVTDLELYASELDDGAGISFVRSFGEATMVMELRDSLSGEVLASFVQRRALGGGPHHGGTGASIHRLGRVVGLAMRDMGEELRKRTPRTAGRGQAECRGGLTRVALGAH